MPLLARRPAVGLGVSFALGTGLGLTLDVSTALIAAAAAVSWIGSAIGALAVRSGSERGSASSSVLMHLCILLTAWIAVSVHPSDSPAGAALLAELDGHSLQVVGIVAGDPDAELAQENQGLRRWKFPLEPRQVSCEGMLRPSPGRISVIWLGAKGSRPPTYGEQWALSGKARAFPPSGMRRKKLYITIAPGHRHLLSADRGGWFAARCYEARRAAANYLAIGMGDFPLETGVLQSLVLGYRERLTDPMAELFKASGTLHIFAISGSHVVVICALIVFVLIALRIPRKLWALFVVPLLSAYTLGTGGEPSAVRACIMGIIYVLGPALGRKADAASALALSAVLILAWSPSQLFEAGFVCSFVVVIGLIVLCPLIDRPLQRLCEADPLRQQAESRRVVFLRWMGRQAGALLALNLAAWIASTPLTAYYFGRFTPISLVSNFLVIPVSSLALVAGCLSMVLGPCASLAADVFNHANLFLMSVLVESMEALLKVPGGSFRIAPWPLWAVAMWYVGVTAAVLAVRGKLLDSAKAE